MYDENGLSGVMPEEIEYNPNAPRKEAPTGVNAPVLDDFGYVAPTAKKDGPTGVSAPVLDDMASFGSDTEKKGAPTGVSAPVLDDNIPYVSEKKGAPTGVTAPVLDDASVPYTQEKLILSDEDIIGGLTPELKARFDALPADKQQQIINMRRTQLGAVAPPVQVTAPVLDEDNYTPPPKTEEPKQPEAPVAAPILDDEPEPPKYQPKYVDEDLERAKAEASKKAVSAQLVSEQKDSKESLRMMLELKEEARRRDAEKGFKICIVLAVVGVISAIAFYLLYSGQLGLGYKNGLEGFGKVIKNSALYIAGIVGVCTLSLIAGIKGLKSLCSFVLLLFGIVQIFPGLPMIPQHKGNMALVVLLYVIALAGTVVTFFMLSGSEPVGKFFTRNDNLNRRERDDY
ncbi:ABC transporter permease [uncultured Ruminococcus sp.]|uniref:ABC transporter permease n=1 Tax=uncultured Ruminococcus sp. TaxID=165186 RepID=UPI0025DB5250|nr:ABC transporter permease [uncultured Ruminococcus sp.]